MDGAMDKEPIDAKIKSAINALQDAAVLQGAGIGDAHYTDIQDPPAQPATRAERAGAILDRAIADLAAIGVECQASAHRETAVAAALAGAPVLSLSLSATVYAPDEVIP